MASILHPPQVNVDEEAELPPYPTQVVVIHETSRPPTPTTLVASQHSQHPSEKSKEFPGAEDDDRFLVTFDGLDDPENPMNWSKTYRWYLTFMASFLVFNATFSSSAPTGLVREMMVHFEISREVAALLISLFVGGYCFGPLLWGPLSEVIGRRPVYLSSFLLYLGFQIGCALSRNTASILIFRLLGGAMAASPLTNSGSMMGDIWNGRERGAAMSLFTLAPIAGPSLGPVCSGFMSVRNVQWRWIYWTLAMFSGACFLLILFTIPETHHSTILKHKAQRKRKDTGDLRWYAAIERRQVSSSALAKLILVRPWQVLFSEPMLQAITVYMSFIYGCLYLLFESYPIVFAYPKPIGHGFNLGISGLMFLPLFIGGCISCIAAVTYYNPKYARLAKQYAPQPVPPEERLPMGVVGGSLFAISFFWFGWTSYPHITFWAPMLAGGCLGMGITLTFLSLFNYILDVYLQVAASALAANTVCRSIFGASFPLFATQMYESLNPRWASTLIGCVALVLVPIPILFIRYGAVLRAKSKYSVNRA